MSAATDKAAIQAASDADEAVLPDAEPQVEADEPVAVETQDDERLGGGREEEEAAEKKQKAADRKARKERQRLARERLQNENASLRAQVAEHSQRLNELSQRVVKNDGESIDAKLADVRQKLEMATTIQAKAARSTGATAEQDYIEATKIRDSLRKAETSLETAKQWQEQNARQQPQQQRQQQAPAAVVRQAKAFAAENDWYAPEGTAGRNRESEVADRISAALDVEGEFPPETQEYWDELRRRCRANKAIGHLMPETEDDSDADEDEVVPRAQPKGPRMSAGGRERPLKRGEVYIPREMKESLIEAGIWDDPVRRDRVIKNYQAQQRAARAG